MIGPEDFEAGADACDALLLVWKRLRSEAWGRDANQSIAPMPVTASKVAMVTVERLKEFMHVIEAPASGRGACMNHADRPWSRMTVRRVK